MARVPGVLTLAVLAGMIGCSVTASAQGSASSAPRPTGVYWRNRPSIQLGPDIRLDLRARVAHHWRRYETGVTGEDAIWRFRRGGINGDIGEHLQFELEHDFNPGGKWRDVFLNWGTFRTFQLRAGRFKLPFGVEALTSSANIDFADRALISEVIAPSRATGVMAHGRFFGRGLTYEAGVFDGDGDNGGLRVDPSGARAEWTGASKAFRVTGAPLRLLGGGARGLRVGGAVGSVDVPEGLHSRAGKSAHDLVEFFPPVYVNGRRVRVGLEAVYTAGPFGVTAEWMQAREQRKRQGLGDVDLSDLVTRGWYTAATWLITGENKNGFDAPRRALFDGGAGAIELAVRYETIAFESADRVGPAFRNPRAEHILGNADRIWTFGVNWFPNRWTRMIANALREKFDDPARTPLLDDTQFWSGILRLQLAF